MTAAPDALPLSFGADQLVARVRHVRRTVGGGELDLHHWLAAMVDDTDLAGRVLDDVDRAALAEALDQRLEAGHLEFPFPQSEAVERASARARRAGHDVVTTEDLARTAVNASAALIRRLVPAPAPVADESAVSAEHTSAPGRRPSHRSTIISGSVADVSDWRFLATGLVVALAVALPLGWILSRQRSSDAEDAVRDRLEEFAAAVAEGNGDDACEMLGDAATDDLAETVRRGLDESEPRPCASAVQVAASERTAVEDEALADLGVDEVDHEEEWTTGVGDDPGRFERATATAVLTGGEVTLESDTARTDRAGSWTIVDPGPILDLALPS